MTKHHSSGPDFSKTHGGTSGGKNANDMYNGYRGSVMNPQTSSEDKAHAHQMMSSYENAAHNAALDFHSVQQNPQSSPEAKADASSKLGSLPKW